MSAPYVIDTLSTGIHVTTEGCRLGSPWTTTCEITTPAGTERLITSSTRVSHKVSYQDQVNKLNVATVVIWTTESTVLSHKPNGVLDSEVMTSTTTIISRNSITASFPFVNLIDGQ
jgi:hypothetical protein